MNGLLQAVRSVDIGIYHFFCLFAGNALLDRLVSHEEANNLLKGGVFFAVYWHLWFRTSHERDSRRGTIVAVLIGAVLTIIVARTVSFIAPFRVRPIFDPTIVHAVYSIPMKPNLENWSAFPSDTAAYFFALAFGVMYLSRRLAVPIALYTLGWICVPRMYLGVHYASDIVVGGAIGIVTAWLSLRSEFLRSTVVRPALTAAEKSPQWFYATAFLVSFEMATVFGGLRDAGSSVLHGVLLALHLQSQHSHLNRPIDAWGGLLAMAGFLVAAGYVFYVLRRTMHDRRAARNRDSQRGSMTPTTVSQRRDISL
jgi:undecaprenyl-diphosphatase